MQRRAYFFDDARGLLTAVAARSNARLTAAMERARRRHRDDPYGALLAVGRAYVRYAIDSTAEFRNLFGDGIAEDDPVIEQCRLEGAVPLLAALWGLHPHADPASEEFAIRMNPHGPPCTARPSLQSIRDSPAPPGRRRPGLSTRSSMHSAPHSPLRSARVPTGWVGADRGQQRGRGVVGEASPPMSVNA
jgi:hypothetical protein